MKFLFSNFNCFKLAFLLFFFGGMLQSQKSVPRIKILKISEFKKENSSLTSKIILLDVALHAPKSVWNHVTEDVVEWGGLIKPKNVYAIATETVKNKIAETTFESYDAILVKKYADWHHQHANGFVLAPTKTSFLEPNNDFLVVDMYLDASKSYIAKKSVLSSTYLLPKKLQNEWELGLANIGLQFFFENKTTASYIVAIPAKFYNKWIRIEIPLQEFRFLDANKNIFLSTVPLQIAALNLTAETNNGLVYRNYVKDAFVATSPNLFKELAVKLRGVFIVTD